MKKVVVALGVLGLVAGLTFATQADSAFKLTGGGQTDVGTSGPGDTIAFNAQQTGESGSPSPAKGQVQYVDREGGKIDAIFHGQVECLEAVTAGDDGAAIFSGVWTNKQTGATTDFEIYAEDNGEPNQGNDQIMIDALDSSPCVEDNETDDEPAADHARGNIQIHE